MVPLSGIACVLKIVIVNMEVDIFGRYASYSEVCITKWSPVCK